MFAEIAFFSSVGWAFYFIPVFTYIQLIKVLFLVTKKGNYNAQLTFESLLCLEKLKTFSGYLQSLFKVLIQQ